MIDFLSRRAAGAPLLRSVCVLCALTFLVPPPGLSAQDKKKATKKYEVKVLGIRATNSNKEVSKELKSIAAVLKKRFKYTGFKLAKKGGGKVEEGKSSTTSLIDGYKVKVTPLSSTAKRVKIKIEGFKREGKKDVPKLNTTVTIDRGGYHLHHWPLSGSDGLIVALTAK